MKDNITTVSEEHALSEYVLLTDDHDETPSYAPIISKKISLNKPTSKLTLFKK